MWNQLPSERLRSWHNFRRDLDKQPLEQATRRATSLELRTICSTLLDHRSVGSLAKPMGINVRKLLLRSCKSSRNSVYFVSNWAQA